MSRPVFSVEADTPILVVAELMLEHRIGGIPVTEDGRVVGIITESDLFRLIVKRQLDQAWQSVQS
jgi:CBS domain-containing protein